MKYNYHPISSRQELDHLFSQIDDYYGDHVHFKWAKDDSIIIHGYFYNSHISPLSNMMFDYSQVITPLDLKTQKSKVLEYNIFATLKLYGSSGRFHRLKDIKGNDILPNIYDEIILIDVFAYNLYLLVKRGSYFGVVTEKGKSVLPIKYDRIFNAGEFTLGIKVNGKVGFANLNGDIIVKPSFVDKENYNIFNDGKALVCLNGTDAIPHYINHYGECIGHPDDEEDITWNDSTSYIGDNDILDAYEGDASNMWNTD